VQARIDLMNNADPAIVRKRKDFPWAAGVMIAPE
jgi:hypothetical protein